MMEDEYLSQRAFAALPEVGVSHVRINKLINQGRLPTNENGKIPKLAGIEAWKTCRVLGFEKAAVAGAKHGGNPRTTKKQIRGYDHDNPDNDDDDAPPQDSDLGARYNKAKTLEKEWMAKRRQLDYEIEKKKWVLVDDVKREAAEVASELVKKFSSLPSRVSVTLENKDANYIQDILEHELNEIIKGLHNGNL
jgi:hypothetical protein